MTPDNMTTGTLKIYEFKNGSRDRKKSSETRNDGIKVRKSLLWHLTIYNMPM